MKSSMHKRQSNQILSRRDFLKLLALMGVTTAGGYALFEYAPWLNYDQQAHYTHRLLEKDPSMSVQMRELVRYATLAANGHNTQPWRFAITENAIEIHPDYTHRLPVVDPNDRELWISLGCALENLIIAARALGLDCGPMSGFDQAKVDEEFFAAGKPCFGCDQEFFPEGHVKSNFLCNLGYGDPQSLRPRLPRLPFNEACSLL